MKFYKIFVLFFFLFAIFSSLEAQNEMTVEEWQRQIDSLTMAKVILIEKLYNLDKANDSIKTENKKLDSILSDKKEEMYKIIGVNSNQVSEYKKKFWDLYNRVENHIGEYDKLNEEYLEISKSKIRFLYEFRQPIEKMKVNLDNFNK